MSRPFGSAFRGTSENSLLQLYNIKIRPSSTSERYIPLTHNDHSDYKWVLPALTHHLKTWHALLSTRRSLSLLRRQSCRKNLPISRMEGSDFVPKVSRFRITSRFRIIPGSIVPPNDLERINFDSLQPWYSSCKLVSTNGPTYCR